MDELLAKLGAQAFNMAIRSGIAITSTYAAQQCTRLLKTVDDKGVYAELKVLQKLLSTKIKVGYLSSTCFRTPLTDNRSSHPPST